MKKSNKRGISLIVLVINIIVIIILALAVILSINKNNPIENARKARFQNDLKTIQEEITLYIADEYVNRYDKYNPNEDNKIQDIVNKYEDYKDKIEVVNGELMLIDDETKVSVQERLWAKEVGIKVQQKNEEPVIPVGFEYLEGTVDTGYVIQNKTDKNEFVWVPVNSMSEFKREGFVKESWNTTDYIEPYTGTNANSSELEEYEAIRRSVEKYKGFYIGRYETSDNGSGIAQSKKDKDPWTDIAWGKSNTDLSGGAVEKSRELYSNSDKEEGSKYAVSTLCYGVQWDVTVRWLEKTHSGISEDSSGYGNYDLTNNLSGSAIKTGSKEEYKINNIYDMCGNMGEWTMEASSTDNERIVRSGNFDENGTNGSISTRYFTLLYSYNFTLGFRLALYIK